MTDQPNSSNDCPACKDTSNLKCVTCGRSISAPSGNASELAKEIQEMLESEKAISLVDKDFLKDCLAAIPSTESVSISRECAEFFVEALAMFDQHQYILELKAALEKNDE